MKKTLLLSAVLLTTIVAFAQERREMHIQVKHGPETMGPMRGPGGTWWKDSELATKLKLTDQQKQQLEQTFLDYRLKLVDLHANVERDELRLQPLMDADQLNEAQISTALDQLIADRGKLEKANAMMNVSMRKFLSTEQWKQLQSLRTERFRVRFSPKGRGERGTVHVEGPVEGPGGPDMPPPPPPGDPD